MELLYRGKFLELVREGRWEFVRRTNSRHIVCILPETEAGTVILIEQFRPPVGQTVIELPAGLVGDDPGAEQEELLNAAKRELLEETGYESANWQELGTFVSSAGLTNEVTTLFLARQCVRSGPGGGVAGEEIRILEIPQEQAASWLRERVESGQLVDAKVAAGLLFLADLNSDTGL